jgi:uncharacterized small protein (DUF1192 family)
MVVCVYSQNLYAGMLAAQSDIDSMPVNLTKRRAQADPATLSDEALGFKRIENELAMEGCNLIIQGPEKNVHILLRSAFKEKTQDGKGTAYCYTGRVVEKSGLRKEFFRLQRSELIKLTGMQLMALSGFRPSSKAFVAPDDSKVAKEIPLDAVDKMVDCFIDYVAKRADIIEAEVRRVDRHLKGGFDHINGMIHEVLDEVRAGFESTNIKLDTAATCNESVFSLAEQKEVIDLKAEVERLKTQLAKRDMALKFKEEELTSKDAEIARLKAQLKEALND